MPATLAFLGPEGTYTEQACIAYDPHSQRRAYSTIFQVAEAVQLSEVDEGIVPIENSVGGSVSATLDLLVHESAPLIRKELVIPIRHFLVVRPGTLVGDITSIYSHPQALDQCRRYVTKHLPQAQEIASMSTAAAVKQMLIHDGNAGAIATERAATLYSAEVIASGIEDYPNNMTRFVVLASSDHPHTGDDKTSICFSFNDDSPGILYSVLGEFSKRKINMMKVESRPTREALGSYIFLIDIEGHRDDIKVREALTSVRQQVAMLKIFGSYPKDKRSAK